MIEQLPPKFKLYFEGKLVGHELHEKLEGEPFITIMHSVDGNGWWPMECIGKKITHDDKRQLTGLQDMHGKDIAFGDGLTIPLCGKKKFTVRLHTGVGVDAVNRNDFWGCGAFNVMELVED